MQKYYRTLKGSQTNFNLLCSVGQGLFKVGENKKYSRFFILNYQLSAIR